MRRFRRNKNPAPPQAGWLRTNFLRALFSVEAVTEAAHGRDHVGNGAQLVAQMAERHIDYLRGQIETRFIAPNMLQKKIAGQDMVAPVHQVPEQVEFLAAERDFLVLVINLAGLQVEPLIAGSLLLGLIHFAAAAQQGFYS